MKNLKERINRCLSWCCFWRKNVSIKHDYPFFSLTPDRNAERIEAYREAMDYALAQNDIKNIAVTGPYGAGKSSFLETYFKDYKDVLRISLAAFLGGMENASNNISEPEDGDKNSDKSRRAEKERRLELSILQQIFYKFSAEDVPYSRLSKIVSVPVKWYWCRVLWLVAVVMAIFGVWQPDFFIPFVGQPVRVLIVCMDCVIFWVSGLVLLVAFGLLAYEVLRLIKKRCVQSVDVSGLGIQMAEQTERSILNRNIDEIIYHFEASKYRTVIFEDIDRFDDVDIFTKLREVNLLLNNAKQIPANHKPIRFIYALKEELFKEKVEKVKFFDFVIPIVPVINASNSRGILHKYLEEKCLINASNTPGLKKFIKDISPYVSDMRLLKNICNEFYAYRKQIPDCTAPVELLGMIVFKNFFPREFAAMHQDDGLVKALMEVRERAIDDGVARGEEEIDKCRFEIRSIDKEKMNDIDSLKKMYFFELMRLLGDEQYVEFENTTIWTSKIINQNDWFETLRKGRIRYHGRWGQNQVDWKSIERGYDPACTYDEHVRRIEGKCDGRMSLLREKINNYRTEQSQIRRLSIVELIASGYILEETITGIIPSEYEKWQEKELFVALVRGGYINEHYRYYISMFYDVQGASSRKDFYFEVAVAKGVESEWDLKLDNVNDVIENIDVSYFAKPSILNYDLVCALVKNSESDKTKAFFGMLSRGGRKVYEFLDGFLKGLWSAQEKGALLNGVFAISPNYVAELIVYSTDGEGLPRDVVERQIGYYIVWVLRSGMSVSIASEVQKFIAEAANMADILCAHDIVKPEDLTSFVKKFDVKFNVLDCRAAKAMGLLDVVIAERAYAVEPNIIKAILEGEGIDVAGFETKNYSVVSRHKQVVACIDTKFKTYLDAVYLKCETQQEDDLERVLNVINREDLSAEDKQKFIHHQWRKSRVDDVKKIKSDEMVRTCVKEDWIVPTWSNAVEVWNRNKDELEPFRVFVNREECYTALSAKGTRGIAWEKDEWWANSFAEDEKLSDDAVAGLLSGMADGELTSYTGKNATPARIRYLVAHNRVKYSNELYRSLKAIGNDSHVVLAAKCAKEFCDEYGGGLVGEDDVKKILLSDQLVRRYAVRMINTLKDLIAGSGDLIDEVVRFINKGNYTEFDECVLDAALDSITPVSLQCRIIQHLGGDADEIRRQLGRIEEPYKKLAGLGSRQQISRWDGVEDFLNFLKEKGIVSTTGEGDGGKIQVNTTRS